MRVCMCYFLDDAKPLTHFVRASNWLRATKVVHVTFCVITINAGNNHVTDVIHRHVKNFGIGFYLIDGEHKSNANDARRLTS